MACKWYNPDLSYTWFLYKETMKMDTFIFGLFLMSKISEEGKDEQISIHNEKFLQLEPIWCLGKAEVHP